MRVWASDVSFTLTHWVPCDHSQRAVDAKGKRGQNTGAYINGIEAEAMETHCVVFGQTQLTEVQSCGLQLKEGGKKEQNRQCNLSKLLIAHSKYRIHILSIHLFIFFLLRQSNPAAKRHWNSQSNPGFSQTYDLLPQLHFVIFMQI